MMMHLYFSWIFAEAQVQELLTAGFTVVHIAGDFLRTMRVCCIEGAFSQMLLERFPTSVGLGVTLQGTG